MLILYLFCIDNKYKPFLKEALKSVTQGSLLLRIGKNEDMEFYQYYKDFDETCITEHYTDNMSNEDLFKLRDRLSNAYLPKLFDSPLYQYDILYFETTIEIYMTIHHQVLDGTSADIFANRLEDVLNSFLKAEKWVSPKEDYQAYIKAEKKYLSSKQAEIDKQFWIDTLRDLDEYPPVIQTTEDMSIGEKLITIPGDLTIKLMNFKDLKGKKLSPFIVASGVIALYIARSTRSKGCVLASGYAGRDFDDTSIKNMLGMFVNVLPLNFKYNPKQSISEHLCYSKETLKNGLIHGKLSINTYAKDLSKLSIDINNLFNYSIVSNSSPIGKTSLNMEFGVLSENEFPLTIRVNTNQDDKLGLQSLRFEYRKDCFNESQINMMINNLLCLFEDIANYPDKLCQDLCIVNEQDKKKLLVDFQGKKLKYETNKTIIDIIKEHSINNGDEVAIKDCVSEITYKQVDEYTDSFAMKLIKQDIKPDDFIAVMLPRTKEFILSVISVMKASAAYVPIDYSYPRERIQYMIEDSKAKFLITTKDVFKQVSIQTETKVLFIEDFTYEPIESFSLPKLSNLAYMIYTSGSTGNPKGVMIEHRSAMAMCAWVKELYRLKVTESLCCYASFSFDASILDIFPALYAGCALHILDDELRFNMDKLNKYISKYKIKCGTFPTKFGMEFLQECNPDLRFILLGGEKLKQLPPRKTSIINGYGPTEFTVASSYHIVNQDINYTNIPIGKPVANSYSYVLDENNQLVPIGTPGELMLSGIQISRGYYNRKELTNEKFVLNPYSDNIYNKTMYHTGDLVRWNDDGELEFLGRIDSQVKLRGFRIELGEIETAIKDFKGITNSVALVKNDSLIAYYTAKSEINVNNLKNSLESKMPQYMVPSFFMQLREFPMTPGGKIDLKKLPVPEHSVINNDELILPETENEKILFDIIAQIIKHNEFGVTTNLFNAGMSSLDAIKIASKISDRYSISFNAQNIMSGKTIRSIENSLLSLEGKDDLYFKSQEDYPLTQSQMGVYYECAKDPNTLKYNIPFALKFSREIDVQRLVDAIRSIVNNHPYIKTHLFMKAQTVRQRRNDEAEVNIELITGTESKLKKFKNDFVKPFQLFTGPLYRVCVYLTPESVNLLADFHHIIFDGASVDIFLKQLQEIYSGNEIGSESFSSFEMALQEQEIENTEKYKKAKAYFTENISRCDEATVLPPDISGNESEGKLCEESVQIESAKVISICKENGITPSNFFLAVVSYCISRFTNSKDILISTISNGRTDTRYDKNFGMLVKTLPLVLNVNTEIDVRSHLLNAQESLFTTLSNECYPFTKVSEQFRFSPQLMYAYQSGVVNEFKLDYKVYKIETLELKKPKFKLSIHIEDIENDYKIAVQYNDALYSKKYIQTFSECCQIVAESFVSDINKSLSTISLLSVKQKRLIDSFNQTKGKVVNEILHSMFEQIVNMNKNKIALIADKERLSYNELNQRANSIAWSLIDKGLNPEDRVGFILTRDSRLIATMLGIIKAGGAYIPIDPQYPPERVQHVITDSKAKFIICDKTNSNITDFDNKLDVDSLLTHQKSNNPNIEIKPDNLCYLIYTSGSTGVPKGVMLTHKGITNYVTNHPKNRHVYELVKNCHTMLSITTVSFDMFLKESFTSLMNGLTLVFANEDETQNPLKLAELFNSSKADAFNATPSRMSQYLQSIELQQAISKCNVIMAGGEAYPITLYNKLRQLSKAILINTYGPTEITVSSNAKILTDDKITIGAPLLNVQEYVMDADANPLPIGVTGELFIGGNGLARGYWDNPEKTDEKFVVVNNERLYKTGDYAKWTDKGEIVILGRTDNQIKLRGLRIELGEIESAIASYPDIMNSVVTIKKIQNNDHICAYYTSKSEIKIEALREFLSKKLTKYMVPTAYMQLKEIPTTPNGKTDIKALPVPMLMAQNDYIPPKNEIEKTFCNIYQSILGISKVGAIDSFFDLGGTSLQVTQVTIDAMNAGYEISYGDIFTNPTPREIAQLLIKRETAIINKPVIEFTVKNKNLSASIDEILQQNTVDNFDKAELRPIGNLLLTGATGFLGIHILKSFLEKESGVVYCLMRKGRQESLEKRLKGLLVYYFDNSFDELFNTRIFTVEGDITNIEDFNKLHSYPIDTVINCAANVKHYAADDQINRINVMGVKNGIDFSFKKACRYIQISTTSVAGLSIENVPPENSKFDEQTLYIGQNMENKYINSKFEAEKLVLTAVSKGLDAKIMRVGNLMARNRDGEFQINFNTNGFVNRLKAYCAIGSISYKAMSQATELAPIDSTAEAILKLATSPSKCCLFHPYNYHYIYIGDIIRIMNKEGLIIDTVNEECFQKAFAEAMKDKKRAVHLAGIIAYLNMGNGKRVATIHTINDYTAQILYRYKFQWPITSDDYLEKFIVSLKELGFFDWQELNV